MSCLDPFRFETLVKDGIPENALEKICSLLPMSVNVSQLLEDLIAFETIYPELKGSLSSMYYSAASESDSPDEAPVLEDAVF